MKAWFGFLIIVISFLLVACSGGKTATAVSPGGAEQFSFGIDQGRAASALPLGTSVSASPGGVSVTVSLGSPATANEIFFKLNYDASKLSPVKVDFAGALGHSVDLAVTDVAGYVDVGTSRVRSAGDAGVSVRGAIATVRFAREPFVSRGVSGLAPTNVENKVMDLNATIVGSHATLTWTEKNCGDYDNNGEVAIADITPVAIHYGVNSGTILSLVDGDHTGEIGISDITPIAINYQHSMAGYRMNVFNGGSWTMIPNPLDGASPYSVGRPASPPNDRAITYTFDYDLQAGDDENFQTHPIGTDFTIGIGSNTTGGSVVVPPPPKVTNLTAAGDQTFGEGVIRLTWDASTDPTVDHYKLWWQVGGNGTNLVTMPGYDNVAAGTTTLDIPSCTKNTTYWFAIWAVNFDAAASQQHGPLSDMVSAVAWYDVPPIPPLTITTVTRNKTTFDPSETIQLGVVTNLDGDIYESVQTFSWTVLSGNATFASGQNTRNATANVGGATTATFQVTVDDTVEQKTGTVMVIGTTMPNVVTLANVSNPKYIFNAWNHFAGAAEDINPYYTAGHVCTINEWASWCGPCKAEMPDLQSIYDTLTGEGLPYYHIGIDAFENQADMDAFLTSMGYNWTAAFWTSDSAVSSAYDALCPMFGFASGYIPDNFLMDRDGNLRHGVNGITKADWLARCRELLGQNFQ